MKAMDGSLLSGCHFSTCVFKSCFYPVSELPRWDTSALCFRKSLLKWVKSELDLCDVREVMSVIPQAGKWPHRSKVLARPSGLSCFCPLPVMWKVLHDIIYIKKLNYSISQGGCQQRVNYAVFWRSRLASDCSSLDLDAKYVYNLESLEEVKYSDRETWGQTVTPYENLFIELGLEIATLMLFSLDAKCWALLLLRSCDRQDHVFYSFYWTKSKHCLVKRAFQFNLPCTLPNTNNLTVLNSPSDVRLNSSMSFWSTWKRKNMT